MRKLSVLSVAFGLITMFASTARADAPPGTFTNAGAAKESCEGNPAVAGRTFENLSTTLVTLWRCTIITQVSSTHLGVAASHPKQAWTVDVQRTDVRTEIYEINRSAGENSWQTKLDQLVPLSIQVIACYNHQGHPIGGFVDNPNCQPG